MATYYGTYLGVGADNILSLSNRRRWRITKLITHLNLILMETEWIIFIGTIVAFVVLTAKLADSGKD